MGSTVLTIATDEDDTNPTQSRLSPWLENLDEGTNNEVAIDTVLEPEALSGPIATLTHDLKTKTLK